MNRFAEIAAHNLATLRAKRPLIHSITNLVTMNFAANALLAMGASPVMAYDRNEVEEMVALADALVINMGTLSAAWIPAMLSAGQKAAQQNKPIVLDPVGSGATGFRTRTANLLLRSIRISVIRGNASEIRSLGHDDSQIKGVDSRHTVEAATQTAQSLAKELNIILAITGPVDAVTDGRRIIRVFNGHPLMAAVSGTGCAATAAIAAFLTVDEDPLDATVSALAFCGLAGEMAGEKSQAPGSFMIHLLDSMYAITAKELENRCRIDAHTCPVAET